MNVMRTTVNPALGRSSVINALAVRAMSGLGQDPATVTVNQASGAATAAGTKFDWGGLINQGFDFAKTFITLRPGQGTVITQGPGGIQVARGADGQPVNYGATNTQVGGNVGIGANVQGFGMINPNTLLLFGVGAIALVFILNSNKQR